MHVALGLGQNTDSMGVCGCLASASFLGDLQLSSSGMGAGRGVILILE